MNYNRIILVGRLTKEPEFKSTPAGVPVTTFSIAVTRPQSAESRQQNPQGEADFFDIVTWRQTAEYAANYLQKGRLVLIEGRVQIRSYTTQDGQNRKAFEVVADRVQNLEKRQDGEGDDMGSGQMGGIKATPRPRSVVRPPMREEAPARGGYEPRPAAAPAAPRGNYAGNAGGGQRPAGRNTPPPANDDNDFQDPFDE